MREFFKNKKVLITGHTGFKGAWLTEIMLNFGAHVTGLSLEPHTKPSLFDVLKLKDKVKNHFADIRNLEDLKKIFKEEQPEIVFHLAAHAIVLESYDDPIRTFSSNSLGTANVLEAVRLTPSVKSAVVITTDKVYENKEWHHAYRENDALGGYDPYSASKAAADIISNCYIQSFFNPKDYGSKHNTLVAIGRAGNVIGGGDWAQYRLVPDIVRSVYEKHEKIVSRNPQSIRPWQHVLEPLCGYMTLAKGLYEGRTEFSGAFNFGPNNESSVTVGRLITEAIKVLGKGEHESEVNKAKHEANLLKLDINKSIAILDWQPKMKFEETLKFTFDWYRNFYDKPEGIIEFTDNQIDSFFN